MTFQLTKTTQNSTVFACVVLVLAMTLAHAFQATAQPVPSLHAGRDGSDRKQGSGRARQIINLYLSQGQKQLFVAEQTTRLMNGSMQESQLILKHGGLGKERLEFIGPKKNAGEIILTVGGHLWNYKPRLYRIYEGFAAPDSFQLRAKQFRDDVASGKVRLSISGNEVVCGRNATIVEIAGENGSKKLWIDDINGVRLKSEELNALGTVVQSSYFTRVEFEIINNPNDFRPDLLPNVPHEAIYPVGPPLENVAAAQTKVPYTIREPALQAGYKLTGIWLVESPRSTPITVLRYTDGVRTFALFEQPLAKNAKMRPTVLRPKNGIAHWSSETQVFTLLGNLKMVTIKSIVDSLK